MSDNEVVKPGDNYKEAQRVGFALISGVSNILKEYERYLHLGDVLETEILEDITTRLFFDLSLGYSSLGLSIGPDPSPDYNGVDMELGFLLSKLVRASSNFFIIIMSYPESWEDNYLNVDLDNLHLYLTIFKRQELTTPAPLEISETSEEEPWRVADSGSQFNCPKCKKTEFHYQVQPNDDGTNNLEYKCDACSHTFMLDIIGG